MMMIIRRLYGWIPVLLTIYALLVHMGCSENPPASESGERESEFTRYDGTWAVAAVMQVDNGIARDTTYVDTANSTKYLIISGGSVVSYYRWSFQNVSISEGFINDTMFAAGMDTFHITWTDSQLLAVPANTTGMAESWFVFVPYNGMVIPQSWYLQRYLFVDDDQFEPDNDPATANVLKAGKKEIHSVSSGQEDWFRVELVPGTDYCLEFDWYIDDFDISVTDMDGNDILQVFPDGEINVQIAEDFIRCSVTQPLTVYICFHLPFFQTNLSESRFIAVTMQTD